MWIELNTNLGRAHIEKLPGECPFCHTAISPDVIFGYKRNRTLLDVFFACPFEQCRKSFIGEYSAGGNGDFFQYLGKVTKGEIRKKGFDSSIVDISPSFPNIYNQAYHAEQEELFEICGVGYRKALEFLIKDYLIYKNPSNKLVIEKKQLGKCIDDNVDDDRIKTVAKRATWLGNDETHYLRIWEGKNLNDLKKLLDLTVHWIEMEKLTESFEVDMPE